MCNLATERTTRFDLVRSVAFFSSVEISSKFIHIYLNETFRFLSWRVVTFFFISLSFFFSPIKYRNRSSSRFLAIFVWKIEAQARLVSSLLQNPCWQEQLAKPACSQWRYNIYIYAYVEWNNKRVLFHWYLMLLHSTVTQLWYFVYTRVNVTTMWTSIEIFFFFLSFDR